MSDSKEYCDCQADEFSSLIPEAVFSAAHLQGYLLHHKKQPHEAIFGIMQWVNSEKQQVIARRNERNEVAGV